MGLSQLLRDRRVRIPAALRSLCACMIYMAGVGNERKRGLASVLWYIVTVLCGQCTSATSSEHFGVERSGFFGAVTFCVPEDDSLRARRLRVNFPIAVVDGAMKLPPMQFEQSFFGRPSIHPFHVPRSFEEHESDEREREWKNFAGAEEIRQSKHVKRIEEKEEDLFKKLDRKLR